MQENCGRKMQSRPRRRRFVPLSHRGFLYAAFLGCFFVLLASPLLAQKNQCEPSAARPCAVLKVCKVAGFGVAVNTPFTFNASILGSAVTIPAGPAPGGYCKVSQSLNVGTAVNIAETVPGGIAVANIDVVPVTSLLTAPNLAAGTVGVKLGPGVTEVTYTDHSMKGGYLEICKLGIAGAAPMTGTFNFTVTQGTGVVATASVPVGLCSPPLEVPAGPLIITEAVPAPSMHIATCTTFPAGTCQILGPLAVKVNVVMGTIATQTIATITNTYK